VVRLRTDYFESAKDTRKTTNLRKNFRLKLFPRVLATGIACTWSCDVDKTFSKNISKLRSVKFSHQWWTSLPACTTGLRSRCQSRKESDIFGWIRSRIPKNTRSRCRSRIFYLTPEVQLNHFFHRTLKFGILARACWNGTNSFETFIETENSCRVPRFPLIASCYKVVDSQTSYTLC